MQPFSSYKIMTAKRYFKIGVCDPLLPRQND